MSPRWRIQITLTDDGTLDRVYDCRCCLCHAVWQERFSNDGSGFPSRGEVREMIEDGHAQVSQGCYENGEEEE